MAGLRWANMVLAILAALMPMAHVLELPNKLALDGPLWLAVQQHLYRGWGPLFGGPAEMGALATALTLWFARRRDRRTRLLTVISVFAYAGMLAAFFLLNDPVNSAISAWTQATLPSNWAEYRLRWESGHALAALLSMIALAISTRCFVIEAGKNSKGTKNYVS